LDAASGTFVTTSLGMLVQQARGLGMSLIVIGSYKHSRTREISFGGTTRHVIQHAGCAILMAN
jgi:nucleotide-binding universal stress UspA family protein